MAKRYETIRTFYDGKPIIKFRCPGCGGWGSIDDDQYNGRVSIQCTECEFHETINLAEPEE